MATTINPKVTITEGKTIQTIWTGIPDFKMGTIGAEEFNAADAETVALTETYDAKDLVWQNPASVRVDTHGSVENTHDAVLV